MDSTAIWALRTALLAVVLAATMMPQLGQSAPQSSTREPATKSSEKNAAAYMDRAEGYMHTEKYAEAAEAYKKVVAIEPANATAYFGLATSQSMLKQWRPAEEAASRYIALREHPEAVAYVTLGRAQQQQGKLQEAAEAYGKAIASNPSHEMLQMASIPVSEEARLKKFLDKDGGYKDKLGGYYNPKAGTYTDKDGGIVDNWGGYTYKDGSYKSGIGDYYDAKTKTFKLASGEKVKALGSTTDADAIKALRGSVEDNRGYDKDLIRKSMMVQIKAEHLPRPPVGQGTAGHERRNPGFIADMD